MIARCWRGWTEVHHADAYEAFLKTKILPALQNIPGYRGGYVLRNGSAGEVEFLVLNVFESMEAVQRFAGADPAVAVIEPEARRLLARFDSTARHYEVRAATV